MIPPARFFLNIFVVVVQSLSSVLNLCDPHGLQHTRLSCPSLSPRVWANSHPLNWWCHPTISSSVAPFSACLQSFPASGSFPVSQLITSVLAIQGTLKSFIQHHSSKSISSSVLSLLYGPTLTSRHDYWRNHSFYWIGPLWAKWCLCFSICCLGFSIAFLIRSKRLLISWKQTQNLIQSGTEWLLSSLMLLWCTPWYRNRPSVCLILHFHLFIFPEKSQPPSSQAPLFSNILPALSPTSLVKCLQRQKLGNVSLWLLS